MNNKKVISCILIITLCFSCIGCSQAGRVAHNISKEANNFNVTRHLVAINMRTDKIMFEVTGTFSILNNGHDELEIVAQVAPNEYKKHIIHINQNWTTYTVEDISGADVDPFKFEINFFPEMLIPIDITQNY